jgi:Recombination endonuclease VII
MYGSFKCGHSKKPSNRQTRGDGKGCGYGCRTCKNRRTLLWMRTHKGWSAIEARKLRQRSIEKRMKEQRGRCAICTRKMKFPYSDHNHKCCPIGTKGCSRCRRGLLCPSCNGGLHLIENKRLHKAAIAYLKKWRA